MKTLNAIVTRMWSAVKASPVEMFLAVLVCCLNIYRYEWEEVYDFDMLLYYFPVLFLFSFMLNQCFREGRLRLIYYASAVVFLPFLLFGDKWTWSATYIVSLALIQLVYLISGWQRDNYLFMRDGLRYLKSLLSAVVLSVIVWVLSLSIYTCVLYIFEIEKANNNMYIYIPTVAFMGVFPLLFLMFIRDEEEEGGWLNRLLDVLLNYVLSPVLLIYAVILYIYFIKITFLWSLPKGMVAYIVVSFTTATFLLKGCQVFLARRYYDWFYNRASLVVVPALAMYWVGAMYRIREYGFTEARVYLVVVGLVLTITALLFLTERWGRYLYAACVAAGLLAVVTYIPGLSAKDIERVSQAGRENGMYGDDFAFGPKYVDITTDKPIDIAGYSSLQKINNYNSAKDGDIRLSLGEGIFSLYDKDGTVLYRKTSDEFLDGQFAKIGITRKDSIPESAYPEMLQLELDSGKVVFETMSLQRDSVYHLYYIFGQAYLKR